MQEQNARLIQQLREKVRDRDDNRSEDVQEQNARLIQQLREKKIRFETSDPITKKQKFLIPKTAHWYLDPCEM